MIFAAINVQAKNHVFNDINHRVIEIFQMLSNKNIKPEQFVERIESRIAEFGLSKTNENAYLAFRTQYNSNPNSLDLFVLICFGFNYQIRFNNKLQFNNPFGRNRSSFTNNMKANLIAFVTQLQTMNSEFHSIPFHKLDMNHLGQGDMVYCDPPYLITTAAYNDGNRGFKDWKEEQELYLYGTLLKLDQQGCYIALSNVLEHKGLTNTLLQSFINNNPQFRAIDLDFDYKNASHNTKRTGSREVLIVNY